MGQCNYCILKQTKAKAKINGDRVVIKNSNFMNGKLIFVLPKGIEMQPYTEPCKKYLNGSPFYEKYRVNWMATISQKCVC